VRNLSQFTKKEINHLFKTGKRVVAHPALVILRASGVYSYGRILPIISRKIGNAPQRNKLKRRLKSIFYEERLFEKGFDLAIITKPGAADLSFDQLKELLLKATYPETNRARQ